MKHLEGNLQPEQIERIKQMEQHLGHASQVVMRLSVALNEFAAIQNALRQLSDYSHSTSSRGRVIIFRRSYQIREEPLIWRRVCPLI